MDRSLIYIIILISYGALGVKHGPFVPTKTHRVSGHVKPFRLGTSCTSHQGGFANDPRFVPSSEMDSCMVRMWNDEAWRPSDRQSTEQEGERMEG